MGKKYLPRGIRKFIRREKARIRREANSPEEERKRIEELLNKFTVKQYCFAVRRCGDDQGQKEKGNQEDHQVL
ncbi:hypothetical protein KAU86_03215 [bacterium]|nr:hypothetical protein [bacterium]